MICHLWMMRKGFSPFQTALPLLIILFLPQRPVDAVVCDGHGFFGDPDSCTRFWVCSPDGATSFDCNPGLIWNEGAKRCDWPYNTVCDKSGETTESTATTRSTSSSSSSSSSSPSSSSSSSTEAPLTSSMTSSSSSRSSSSSSSSSSTRTRGTPSTEATTPLRKDQCKNRVDGFYPNWLKHCSEYFLCMGGEITNRRKCPYGLVFDIFTAKCQRKDRAKPPCGTSTAGKPGALGGGATSINSNAHWLLPISSILATSAHLILKNF